MTSIALGKTPFGSRDGQVVVHIHDDLDVTSLSEIAANVEQAVEHCPDRITIDMSSCRFLDAQVAGFVLSAAERLRLLGVRTMFRGCRPEVARLLALVAVARGETPERRGLVA